mmetsp:Transcript_72825/g.115265  ORF Transcript_72825/g.115265 Transcript_72825/m.115265 type:complete len:372 (+) Transcript_72825:53-1168(+)
MVAGSEASSSLVRAYFGNKAKVDVSELFGQCSKSSVQNAPRVLSGLRNAIGPSAVARLSTPGDPSAKLSERQFRQALEAFSPSIEKEALRSLDTAKNACPSNLIVQGSLADGSQIIPAHGSLADCRQSLCTSELVNLIDGCREAVRPRRQVASSAGASAKSALDAKDMDSQIRQMVECLKETGAPLPGLLSLAVRKNQKAEVAECMNDTDKSCQCPSEISHATTPSWRSRSFPPHYRRIDVDSNSVCSNARATPEPVGGRQRLPPLPDDATQRRMSPLSEVVRLTDIDSQVHEANAMLVESFLNVKRRALAGPLTASEASYNSSCSAVERSGSNTRDSSAPSSARRFQRKARQPDMECLPEDGESHIGSEV